MKIEIDLNDILFDEDYGSETLQESVRRQVIESIKKDLEKGVKNRIDLEVQKIINEEVLTQVKDIAPRLLNDLLDIEYQPVTSWGSKDGEPTTLRKKFIDILKKQFIFERKNSSYDNNEFTKSVLNTVEIELGKFKKEYNSKVDELFTQEALNYATEKLKQRLNIK